MDMKICGWTCVLAGIWLIVAPFALGYSDNSIALWNDIILGIIVFAAGSYMCSFKKQA